MRYIINILIIAFFVSIIGYILSVLREKYYLKNNIIIVDNKSLTSDDFKDIDMNQMSYNGLYLKTGDEIKIVTENNQTYKGTLLGGKFEDGILKVITKTDEILEFRVSKINKVKIIREYGKFFTQ